MQTTVLIEGLPSEVTVLTMARLAEAFGRLSRVVVEHDGDELLPEANCWITYQESEDAARAIQSLRGRAVCGRRVVAQWAIDESDPIEMASQRLSPENSRSGMPAGIGLA